MVNRLTDAIVANYYATTAQRGHARSLEHYELCAAGLRRWLTDWLPREGAACLDLACGCGEFQFLLEQQGLTDTTGVDLAADELAEARRYVRGRLVHGDVVRYLQSTPSSSVDFISALNILEHLDNDSLHDVLGEAARSLKPGGVLVAMVPNAVSPYGALTRYWDITHQRAFTTNSIRQLAAAFGFDGVEFRECGPRAHGFVSAVRAALWQLVRAGIAFRLLVELGTVKDGVYTMDMLVRLRRSVAPDAS